MSLQYEGCLLNRVPHVHFAVHFIFLFRETNTSLSMKNCLLKNIALSWHRRLVDRAEITIQNVSSATILSCLLS